MPFLQALLYDEDQSDIMIVAWTSEGTDDPPKPSKLVPKACGMAKMSPVPKKATVHLENGQAIKVEQKGPWAPVRSLSGEVTLACEKEEEEFSLYVNERSRHCLNVEKYSAAEPLKATVILRGQPRVKGRLEFLREGENVRIFGSIVGLEEGEYDLVVLSNADHSEKELLGNVLVGSNHAGHVNLTIEKIGLIAPKAFAGNVVAIQKRNGLLAQGQIQTEDQIERVVSAKAKMDNEDILAEIDFVQEGDQDHVHIMGSIFALESGNFSMELASGSGCDKFSEEETIRLFSWDAMNGSLTEIDTFAEKGVVDLHKPNSMIGSSLLLIDDLTNEFLGCAEIEQSADFMAPRCKLPAVEPGEHCILSGFAWSYDAKQKRCVVVNTAECRHATGNQFATEAECKEACPVEAEFEIVLVPSGVQLEEILASTSPDNLQRVRLCHSISTTKAALTKGQVETACGEKLSLRWSPEGFYLDDKTIFSVQSGKRFILFI